MDRKQYPQVIPGVEGIALVGKNVRRIRLSLGISLSGLAHHAGIAVSTLHDLESEETRDPSLSTVLALSNALCVPIWRLFDESRATRKAA